MSYSMLGDQTSRSGRLSRALSQVSHSGIRQIATLAVARPGTIRLEIGEPDFPTPAHIVAAAKLALDQGWTKYTDTPGIPSLRAAIADKVGRVNGLVADPDNVVVGPGAIGVLAATLGAFINPGDEVLVPDPRWPNYDIILAWSGAQAVSYRCGRESDWQPDLDRLEHAVTSRTTAILMNSPNNPTGAVWSQESLVAVAQLASRHNLWIVSDECYDELAFTETGTVPGVATFSDPDRTVSIFSFSKTYSMTGWRVGYGLAPRQLVDGMIKMLESFSSSTTSVSQKAAEAALLGPQSCVSEMREAFRRRRDLAVRKLAAAGSLVNEPAGAIYVLADTSSTGLASDAFALQLLDEVGVAVAPGGSFGGASEGTVRISLGTSDEVLSVGVDRICAFLKELGTGGGHSRAPRKS